MRSKEKKYNKKNLQIMNKIKILDCTLRDGGYYNNWDFSRVGFAGKQGNGMSDPENCQRACCVYIRYFSGINKCGFQQDISLGLS